MATGKKRPPCQASRGPASRVQQTAGYPRDGGQEENREHQACAWIECGVRRQIHLARVHDELLPALNERNGHKNCFRHGRHPCLSVVVLSLISKRTSSGEHTLSRTKHPEPERRETRHKEWSTTRPRTDHGIPPVARHHLFPDLPPGTFDVHARETKCLTAESGERDTYWSKRTLERRQLRTSLSGLLSLSVRARVVLCLRETCRVQTCGRVSAHVRVCTRGGAVRHAAVFCRVWCGTFFWRAGRCVASRLRKVAASLCLHCANTRCTPGRRSGRRFCQSQDIISSQTFHRGPSTYTPEKQNV